MQNPHGLLYSPFNVFMTLERSASHLRRWWSSCGNNWTWGGPNGGQTGIWSVMNVATSQNRARLDGLMVMGIADVTSSRWLTLMMSPPLGGCCSWCHFLLVVPFSFGWAVAYTHGHTWPTCLTAVFLFVFNLINWPEISSGSFLGWLCQSWSRGYMKPTMTPLRDEWQDGLACCFMNVTAHYDFICD